MLGLDARPLCFSFYAQPLITCTNYPIYNGVCVSLNNELLPNCLNYPACVYPTTPIGPNGPVTIVNAKRERYYTAFFTAPAVPNVDDYCEAGYFARCLSKTPIN